MFCFFSPSGKAPLFWALKRKLFKWTEETFWKKKDWFVEEGKSRGDDIKDIESSISKLLWKSFSGCPFVKIIRTWEQKHIIYYQGKTSLPVKKINETEKRLPTTWFFLPFQSACFNEILESRKFRKYLFR